MSDQVRIEVLRRLVDAFNEQDVDAALDLFAEDGVWEASRGPDLWGRRFSGHTELRAGMTERFDALPDGRYSDHSHVVFGDRGFSEWTFTATTRNGETQVRGCDIWTFEGGQDRLHELVLEDRRDVTAAMHARGDDRALWARMTEVWTIVDDSRISRATPYQKDLFVHHFRVNTPAQMDEEFAGWIADAYEQVGCGNR